MVIAHAARQSPLLTLAESERALPTARGHIAARKLRTSRRRQWRLRASQDCPQQVAICPRAVP